MLFQVKKETMDEKEMFTTTVLMSKEREYLKETYGNIKAEIERFLSDMGCHIFHYDDLEFSYEETAKIVSITKDMENIEVTFTVETFLIPLSERIINHDSDLKKKEEERSQMKEELKRMIDSI